MTLLGLLSYVDRSVLAILSPTILAASVRYTVWLCHSCVQSLLHAGEPCVGFLDGSRGHVDNDAGLCWLWWLTFWWLGAFRRLERYCGG
jgi:hypothetical protein